MKILNGTSINMKNFYVRVIAGGILSFTVGTASALPLNITDIDGSWDNGTPAGNITAISNVASPGIDSVRWGGASGNIQSGSGYDFAPAGDLIPVTLDSPFALGVFKHINQPITSGSEITDIDYLFQFNTNGSPINLTDTFHFDHNETPNSTGTSPADDDIVTVSSVSLNQLITVGTDTFFFNMLGFSLDGGTTISNVFRSPEGGSNSATLFAIVTDQPLNVPEPGTVVLLFGGLLGLAGFRKENMKRGQACLGA